MLHTQAFKSEPSQVTVKFDDGAHSFPLRRGATLAELATCIDQLEAQHGGTPISIDIEIRSRHPGSPGKSQSRHPFTH